MAASSIERRWRLAAVVLTAGAGLSLVTIGLSRAAPFAVALGTLTMLAAVAAYLWRQTKASMALRIDADGGFTVASRGAEESARAARVYFCARWLIVLSTGTTSVAIWPDSVAQPSFRRILAYARWARRASTGIDDALRL